MMGVAELLLIFVVVGVPIAIIFFVVRVRSGQVKSKKVLFGVIGFFIGGLIGFLLRPAAPFIGQLPLETVLSRGGNLGGLDQLMVSIAETSFNYMLGAAIIGGVGGILTALFLERGKQVPPAATPQAESKMQFQPAAKVSKQVELDQSPEQVVNILGQPEKTVNLGAKLIYVYKDMKIVFMDRKVSDVQ
jgi:hypothetical protein